MGFMIEWDAAGERIFEIGCDRGVLYRQEDGAYPTGVAWNGLSNVSSNPSGGESTKLYADNIPYVTLRSAEEFGLTIECYYYPPEFGECDGFRELTKGISVGQQTRKNFGLSYRTKVGNDQENEDYGYKIHLVYGCSVSPSEKGYQTVSDSPDAITFSYEATSDPVIIPGASPASEMIIDSTKAGKVVMDAIEAVLYGTAADDDTTAVPPRLPMPEEILQIAREAQAA